jgi:hypothetical protein
MQGAWVLPAIRTVQGGAATYIASTPFAVVALWPGPLSRAQRRRMHALADRLVGENSDAFGPLWVSINGALRFAPLPSDEGVRGCGLLSIDLIAKLTWRDGGVHAAAIANAVRRRPNLAANSLGVVIDVSAP